MSVTICPSCLTRQFENGTCTSCGFNSAEYKPGKTALPLACVVGSYRVGVLKSSSRQSQIYAAVHTETSAPVILEEFFPANMVGRVQNTTEVVLAEKDEAVEERYEWAVDLIEKSTQKRPMERKEVFRANNTIYSVFDPVANVKVAVQCEVLADNPWYFRDQDGKPMMSINALSIPPMPQDRPYDEERYQRKSPVTQAVEIPDVTTTNQLITESVKQQKQKKHKKTVLFAGIAAALVIAAGVTGIILGNRSNPDNTAPVVTATPEPVVSTDPNGDTGTDNTESEPKTGTGEEGTLIVNPGESNTTEIVTTEEKEGAPNPSEGENNNEQDPGNTAGTESDQEGNDQTGGDTESSDPTTNIGIVDNTLVSNTSGTKNTGKDGSTVSDEQNDQNVTEENNGGPEEDNPSAAALHEEGILLGTEFTDLLEVRRADQDKPLQASRLSGRYGEYVDGIRRVNSALVTFDDNPVKMLIVTFKDTNEKYIAYDYENGENPQIYVFVTYTDKDNKQWYCRLPIAEYKIRPGGTEKFGWKTTAKVCFAMWKDVGEEYHQGDVVALADDEGTNAGGKIAELNRLFVNPETQYSLVEENQTLYLCVGSYERFPLEIIERKIPMISEPSDEPGEPETQQSEPETQQGEPETQQVAPETQQGEPEKPQETPPQGMLGDNNDGSSVIIVGDSTGANNGSGDPGAQQGNSGTALSAFRDKTPVFSTVGTSAILTVSTTDQVTLVEIKIGDTTYKLASSSSMNNKFIWKWTKNIALSELEKGKSYTVTYTLKNGTKQTETVKWNGQ